MSCSNQNVQSECPVPKGISDCSEWTKNLNEQLLLQEVDYLTPVRMFYSSKNLLQEATDLSLQHFTSRGTSGSTDLSLQHWSPYRPLTRHSAHTFTKGLSDDRQKLYTAKEKRKLKKDTPLPPFANTYPHQRPG